MTNVERQNIEAHKDYDNPVPTDSLQLIPAITRLMRLLTPDELFPELVRFVIDTTAFDRAILLLCDADDQSLTVVAQAANEPATTLAQLDGARMAWMSQNDDTDAGWRDGKPVWLNEADSEQTASLNWLTLALGTERVLTVPLVTDDRLVGVLLADSSAAVEALAGDIDRLALLAPALAVAVQNACSHGKTVSESAARLRQLTILRQIDRELNDNIHLEHVFAITLDWALRYTNAHAASLAFYSEETGELRPVADVGYALKPAEMAALRHEASMTPAHRVGHTGRAELIPDVSLDKDYLALSPVTRSLLVAPVAREDRVIAVITVESKKLNYFTEDHLDFIEKLSARAGVAIDNARLFAETARERSKLERILRNTADIIVVVDEDDTIDIMNASAMVAFGLDPARSYRGQPIHEVLKYTELLTLYREAVESGEITVGEVRLIDERTYYVNLAPCAAIGWIIVMHDISPLKKTERLKNEIISTVSHDLKQPLGIMHGFAELLMLNADDTEQVRALVPQIQRAINSMRQLIDDQLDLARLEAGVQLQIEPVYLRVLLTDSMEAFSRTASEKALTLRLHMTDDATMIYGDRHLIYRIFTNVIGNAVKYTPQFGQIDISVDTVGDRVRVAVKDNGYGISPEDQARIFDRFYRVRRPEHDGVDGTGLGLAIVKRLVDLHSGQIGLESTPGEGATFTITLPLTQALTDDAQA